MLTACEQGLDRARRVLEGDVAEAPLLVQPAEPRTDALEAIQRRERLVDTHEVAQADRRDQQQVAVVGRGVEQRLRAGERLLVPAVLCQVLERPDLELRWI